MGDLLPQIALDLASGPIHPRSLKPDAEAVWLEIGFGGGEHMVAQAALHPEVLILGAEPFLNGAASAIRHIEAARVDNVRLHVGDVRDVIAALPNTSLDRVFILFPDPWPKARHHKRRLIQSGLITDFARRLDSAAFFADPRFPLDRKGGRRLADAGLRSPSNPL
jgi:tRNA (guanine-N7-)-methyltransferase